MSALLAVETSGSLCSLAIHVAGRWLEDTQNVERLHNRVVLTSLERLTSAAGISRRGFHAVAFGAGPGSFTGIRIAAAVAQGVALASDARVVPVPSSLAMAAAARPAARQQAPGKPLLTVTRSRRDAYYLAGYDVGQAQGPARLSEDRLHHGEALPDGLGAGQWVGSGDLPPWWPKQWRFLDDVQVTAVTVGELALQMLERGEARAPESGLPVYVTGDSPWRPIAG